MDRLSRVYENVFATVYKWRKKIGRNGTVTVNVVQDKQIKGYPSAERYWGNRDIFTGEGSEMANGERSRDAMYTGKYVLTEETF